MITSAGDTAPDLRVMQLFSAQSNRPAYTVTFNLLAEFGRKHGFKGFVPRELSSTKTFIPVCLPVFHADFPRFCEDYVAAQVGASRNDPWLVGYFSDNELPADTVALDVVLQAGPNDPCLGGNFSAATNWLAQRHGGPVIPNEITQADREAFVGFVFGRYYQVVADALRRHDPNHLYLGSRLHKHALKNEHIFRAAGESVDVVSVNFYAELAPSPAMVALWRRGAGDKPFLISEFYVKADDWTGDNRNGGGWLVRTQGDRGRFYENFVLRLMEERCFVSWQWFKYRDTGTTGSNKGLVDVHDQPYPDFSTTVVRINPLIHSLADYLDSRR
jgi:hypothetical protein